MKMPQSLELCFGRICNKGGWREEKHDDKYGNCAAGPNCRGDLNLEQSWNERRYACRRQRENNSKYRVLGRRRMWDEDRKSQDGRYEYDPKSKYSYLLPKWLPVHVIIPHTVTVLSSN